MREILFRAWDGKRYSIGNPKYFDDSVNFRFHHFDIDCEKPILEQFTGLTDKNGNKIFEGDVLSYEDVAGVKDGIGNVLFGLFYGAWIVFVDDYEENHLSDVAYSCEVIGNIHDNPELLT